MGHSDALPFFTCPFVLVFLYVPPGPPPPAACSHNCPSPGLALTSPLMSKYQRGQRVRAEREDARWLAVRMGQETLS